MEGGAILHDIPSEQYLQFLFNNPVIEFIGNGVYSNTFILTLPEPNIIVGFYPGKSLSDYTEINKVLVKIVPVIDREQTSYISTRTYGNIVEKYIFLDEVKKQLDIYEKTNINLEPLCPKVLHSLVMDYENTEEIEKIDILIKVDTHTKEYNTHGIIFMEYIDGSITQNRALKKYSENIQMIDMIHISFMYEYKRLINAGYIHADLHTENVLFVPKYTYSNRCKFRLVFIDFMMALSILPDKIDPLIKYFENRETREDLFTNPFIDTITDDFRNYYYLARQGSINAFQENKNLTYEDLFIIKIFANSQVFLSYVYPSNSEFNEKVKKMEDERKIQIEKNLKSIKTGDIQIKDKNFTMTRTDGKFLFTQANPVAINAVEEPVAINAVEEPVAMIQQNRDMNENINNSIFRTSYNYDPITFALYNWQMYKLVTKDTFKNINIVDKNTNPIVDNWKFIRNIRTNILEYIIDNQIDEKEEYDIYKELYKIEDLQNSIQVYKGVIKAMSNGDDEKYADEINGKYRIDYDVDLENNMNSKIKEATSQIEKIVDQISLKLKR